ncbi:MAG: ABC transporter permease [Anaerolineales bacterium]|nr:ABC transporter permease [Anaerolineales bacterium]
MNKQESLQNDFVGPITEILPSRGWVNLKLHEVWAYRELLFFLTWRDIKVRYKQTVLGALWAIIQPVMTMVVFSLFFGQLAKIPSGDVPYPIFSFAAVVPWTFFSNSVTTSANSLVGSAQLIKKVFFPRLVVPIASVLGNAVDFLLAFTVLILMMLGFGIWPTAAVLWIPWFTLLAFITALGVGLWLSALNVEYRDIRYAVTFLVSIWQFASPVAYSSSLIENDLLRTLYGLNPMAGVIEGFRWSLLGSGVAAAPGPMLWVSTAVSVVLLVTGAFYFRRMERNFADVV